MLPASNLCWYTSGLDKACKVRASPAKLLRRIPATRERGALSWTLVYLTTFQAHTDRC